MDQCKGIWAVVERVRENIQVAQAQFWDANLNWQSLKFSLARNSGIPTPCSLVPSNNLWISPTFFLLMAFMFANHGQSHHPKFHQNHVQLRLAPAFPAHHGVHGVHLGLAAGRRTHPHGIKGAEGSLGCWWGLGSVTNSNICHVYIYLGKLDYFTNLN